MTFSETTRSAVLKLTSLLDCKCHIPPEQSLTDYDMALLWLRMKQQGMDKYLFCSGDVNTFEEFKAIITNETVWCYAGFSKENGEPVALAFLDCFLGRTARLHYTFFRNPESIENKEKYAEAFFDLLFSNITLDCLILTTPTMFRHSNIFARDVGCQFVGAVPSVIPVKNFKTGEVTFPMCNLYTKTSPYYTKGCD